MDTFSYLLGKKSSGGGGGSERDWSQLGYSSEPPIINEDFEYSKWYYDEWTGTGNFQSDAWLVYAPLVDTSNITNFNNFFGGCRALMYVPKLNTSKGTSFKNMFTGCLCLATAPKLDTSRATDISYMFANCSNLTFLPVYNWSSVEESGKLYNIFQNSSTLNDESLDNVLKSCITAVNYSGAKTLSDLGIRKSYYPQSKIESLPSYQAFLDAGWTTGY